MNTEEHHTICGVAVDPDLEMTTNELNLWIGELDLNSVQALVEAPGFPMPTESTAHLPLEQRHWQMAEALMFLLRAKGIDIHSDGEMAGDHPAVAEMIKLSKKR